MSVNRPIAFSKLMVLALLAGQKTQARRLVRGDIDDVQGRPVFDDQTALWALSTPGGLINMGKPPTGVPGDTLWVRENWRAPSTLDHLSPVEIEKNARSAGLAAPYCRIRYDADGTNTHPARRFEWGKLRVGRYMPRWASRIGLTVVGVTPQRLQSISSTDALAEGVLATPENARAAFETLWENIHGVGSWATDPWVWRIEFQVGTAGGQA